MVEHRTGEGWVEHGTGEGWSMDETWGNWDVMCNILLVQHFHLQHVKG